MTHLEVTTRSNGNIGLLDRAIRTGVGLAVLFAALHMSIDGDDAFPLTKLFATIVVLTGIAGWDPFYAAFRTLVEKLRKTRNIRSSLFNPA